MPEKKTLERARADAREGKAPSTQAGEFVREEIHHVREGKHGARRPDRPSPSASRPAKTSATRSRAVQEVLKREGPSAASPRELSRQASSAARRRSATAA